MLGARVGGLTALPAQRRIERAVGRPITIVYRGETMVVTPSSSASAQASTKAVHAALAATPRSHIGAAGPVTRTSAVQAYVDQLAKRFARKPVSAEVIGATRTARSSASGRLGFAVEQEPMKEAIAQQLRPARARRSR